MKKIMLLTSCIALGLAGCTIDPYTGEKKTSNTAKGASIGGSVAAVAAYLDNKNKDSTTRNQRILKAATAGAAIGGGVGYYMDTQEKKLREKLQGSGVSVVRDGNNINLIMPGNITFDTNSSDINAGFYDVLDSVALVLVEFNKTVVAIAGHTDSTGSAAANQVLSQKRAQSVANYLKSQKVASARFEVFGFGPTQPIADNSTASGRLANRRVEITLHPVSE
jgi:outer membrane protein OmpA-like peptidoglycan-associated protein